jgi:regulator of sigma E protease
VAGKPQADSPAAVAGLQPGDRIVAVAGQPVQRWEEVEAAIQTSKGKPLPFLIEREGGQREMTVTPRLETFTDLFGDERQIWVIGVGPLIPTTIGRVMEDFPAAVAGLRQGDKIIAMNGEPVQAWEELAKRIHKSAGQEVALTVERGNERFQVTLTPRTSTQQEASGRAVTVGLIGISPVESFRYERVDPLTALYHAGVRTVDTSIKILWVLVKIVEGAISPQTIGGPILMAQMTGEQVQQGLLNLIFFTALLSINLGVLNLLPIPILDGGHLFFFVIEMLRGRPLSLKKREIAQRVGLALLVALMVFAFYNDIFRLLGRQ